MRDVLVIEDHPLVAEATAQLLRQRFDDLDVVTAGTAPQALSLLDDRRERWFRVFLDLTVPGAFGLSLAKQIADRGFASICCVVSAHDRDDYVQQLRAWGFLGYVAKSTPVASLISRLGDAVRGIGAFPPALPVARKNAIRLTSRQSQILSAIQQGLSSKQIAREIHLAEGTVNNKVAGMLQLLHADSRSHLVAKAISLGLLDPVGTEPQGR